MHKAANDNSGPDTRPKGDAPARKCPICGKPATIEATPFCSKRVAIGGGGGETADVDLHRWLGEGYRVPASRDDDASDIEEDS